MTVNGVHTPCFVLSNRDSTLTVTSEEIQSYTETIDKIELIIYHHMQKAEKNPSLYWYLLNELPSMIDPITSLGCSLRNTTLCLYSELHPFLKNELYMRLSCQKVLDCALAITREEEKTIVPYYEPLIVAYLQTRNGSDLIAAQGPHTLICSQYKALKVFANSMRSTSLALFEESPIQKRLKLLDLQLSCSDPIALALQQLEKAIANTSSSEPLSDSGKKIIDWGIDLLRNGLNQVDSKLKKKSNLYEDLPRLQRLMSQAARQFGRQILQKNKWIDEETVMRQLYERIGEPGIEGNSMEWMKSNFHYYLNELITLLATPPIFRENQLKHLLSQPRTSALMLASKYSYLEEQSEQVRNREQKLKILSARGRGVGEPGLAVTSERSVSLTPR